MDWVEDVGVRRALRSAIAQRLVNTTRAGDRIFFERTSTLALSDMPGINIVSFPPTLTNGGDEVHLSFGVVGVIAQPDGDPMVMDECGICIDALVVAADEFDNEICESLLGLSSIANCPTHCALSEMSPSVLQFSSDGAKPSVLIRRLVSATYIKLGNR